MLEIFKQFASDKGYVFLYARKDYQNLFNGKHTIEETEDEQLLGDINLFMDPPKWSLIFEKGNPKPIGKKYRGAIFINVNSDIDEVDYEYRHEKYIKPLEAVLTEDLTISLNCENDLQINSLEGYSDINIFYQNLDGIVFTYDIDLYND